MIPIRPDCQPSRCGRFFCAFLFLSVIANIHAAERPAAGVAAHTKVLAPAVAIAPSSFLNNFMGLNLVDQDGRTFRVEQLIDRIVLFNFIYTSCPTICPVQTGVLAQVMDSLPEDVRRSVRFVSVSIDPAKDDADRLKVFATQMHADRENWRFLTGDVRQIDMLAQRLHLFDASQRAGADRLPLHQSSIWLVDNEGRTLQRYQGDPPDRDRLVRELSLISNLKFEPRGKH